MAETETVNLTISTAEVQSISDVATIVANEIQNFANKYGVGHQYDKEMTEQDLIFFLAKRNALDLEQLEVHILDNGEIGVGTFRGRRKATLIFNINYVGRGYKF